MSNPAPPTPPEDADAQAAADDSVGVAECLADGTLHLMLRTQAPDGMIGEAMMVVAPGDGRYAAIQAHVGNLAPGESAAIPPFPSAIEEDDGDEQDDDEGEDGNEDEDDAG